MVISAIEMKLLMVETVAQCVKIKSNQKFFPITNLCMNYGLQMKAMSAIEIMSSQIGKTGWALPFVILQKSQWSEINYTSIWYSWEICYYINCY